MQSDRLIDLYSAYNSSISIQGLGWFAVLASDIGIPDLVHFVYKNEMNQIVIPRMDDRIYDYRDYQKYVWYMR